MRRVYANSNDTRMLTLHLRLVEKVYGRNVTIVLADWPVRFEVSLPKKDAYRFRFGDWYLIRLEGGLAELVL